MSTIADTDIKEIKSALEANTKAIADLTLEMRVGFANSDKKMEVGFAQVDTKFAVIEERTKLGFWGFIFRGTALAFLAALTAILVKYLFPILPPQLPGL